MKELRCPRCLELIRNEAELRKHVLCFFCREKMIVTRWAEKNLGLIYKMIPTVMIDILQKAGYR